MDSGKGFKENRKKRKKKEIDVLLDTSQMLLKKKKEAHSFHFLECAIVQVSCYAHHVHLILCEYFEVILH